MIISTDLTFFGLSPYIFWCIIGCFAVILAYSFFVIRGGFALKLPFFMLFSSFLGMVTGARLFSVISNRIYFENTGNYSPDGLVFYGGLFGFLAVFWILQRCCFKSQNKKLWDAASVSIPLFHGFGRIGCGFSGCCFGVECQCFFVEYSDGIRRFPVQFIGAVLEFLLFFALFRLLLKRKYEGNLIKIYLTAYSVGRFVIEFLRGDEVRGMLGVLSFGQVCSIALFGIIIYLWSEKGKV